MARTFMYIMIAVSLTFMLYISGITTDSGSFSSTIINSILGLEDVTNQDNAQSLWGHIFIAIGIITLTAAASIIAGNASIGIVSANSVLLLFIVGFVSDYMYVMGKADELCGIGSSVSCGNWVYWVISIVFVPLIVGLLFTFYEWVKGVD